ncbi:MAG: redoxin domain-containing protein, partial [Polyangiaceae bacterium]
MALICTAAACKKEEPPSSAATLSSSAPAGSATPSVAASAAAADPATATGDVQVGKPPPDFTATAQDGTVVHLAALKGKPVVVYFYPK